MKGAAIPAQEGGLSTDRPGRSQKTIWHSSDSLELPTTSSIAPRQAFVKAYTFRSAVRGKNIQPLLDGL